MMQHTVQWVTDIRQDTALFVGTPGECGGTSRICITSRDFFVANNNDCP